MGVLTAIGARLLAALMMCILTSAAIAAPGAEVYGGKPDISDPELSPDGTMVAALVPRGDDVAVRISKLGTTKACDYVPQGSKARNVFWANNNQAVLEVSFFYAPGKTRQALRFTTEVYRYLSINTSCDVSAELLRDHPQYGIVAGFNFLGRAGGGNELIFSALTISQTGDTLDIYKVDATTGKSAILEKGKSTTTAWYVDGSGTPRLRGDRTSRDSTFTVSARLTGSNDWTEVYTSTSATPDAERMGFMGLASRADIAYVSTRNGGDREAIYEYDLRAKALGRQIFAHARYDAGGIVLDDYSRTPIGVSYTDDHLRVQYFDRTYAQRQADVAATFPGEVVRIEGASADGTRYLTYVEGVENPGGVYHLVDQKLNDMSLIGARYPSIRAADIAPVRSFSYKARDGMDIPAYLTTPPGGGKALPLVVVPHGGPWSRDNASFDNWAQFLATRGYAVLQPNFRGSTGYGTAFEQAGRFQWGLKMQDDLTDGVKALIADGTVDGSRVCIFGWSYGGYAAMAGLALSPEVYKCGAAGAGISDLLTLTGQLRRENALRDWEDVIGDPTNDRERLIATSPFRQVSRITAPLLMFHGREDTVVPVLQSEKMLRALDQAGKSAELIVFDGEDHWIHKSSSGRRVLSELEKFLGQHLKK